MEGISNNKSHNLKTKEKLDGVFAGLITEKEIIDSYLSQWTKELLLLAYYEKTNKHYALKYLKSLKNKYQKDNYKKKTLNKLQSRFNNDTKLEDNNIYYKYLNVSKDEIKEEPVIVKEEVVEEPKIEEVKTTPVKFDVSQIKIVERRDYLIKEVFAKEIAYLEKIIYLELQNPNRCKKAIKAWDRLQVIIEKPVTDKHYFDMIYSIVKKLELAGEITFEEAKIKKYIKTDTK